jgi:hypothetical protein
VPGRPLSRRTTLGSALAAPLALAACDIDPPARESRPSSASPPPPEDSELVAGVVAALVRAQSVLDAATTAAPSLAARLAPLRTAHAEHLDVLAGAVPEAELPAGEAASVPSRPARALAVVRRSEQRLQREAREGCLAAASGDLARVLASVAASTAQHGAALAGPAGPAGEYAP